MAPLRYLSSAALALALGIPGQASSQTERAVLDAVTTIGFEASTLSGLGLELEVVGRNIAGTAGHAPHPLSVAPPDALAFGTEGPIGLRAGVDADGFQGFAGSLRLRGGFRLRGAART